MHINLDVTERHCGLQALVLGSFARARAFDNDDARHAVRPAATPDGSR